jgi:predicted nuclease with TOPRIM domain
MKQFDLVNKLRERINNLEAEDARLRGIIRRLQVDIDDWKTRAQYATRISHVEREIRLDVEARLLKAEAKLAQHSDDMNGADK